MTNTHPVDAHVGRMIRLRRTQIGISQYELAAEAGVTYQQLQKYERAANRISASRLHTISRALGVGPDFFFEGLSGEAIESPSREVDAHGFARTSEGLELARYYGRLTPAKRRGILDLVRVIVSDQDDEAGDPA